MTKGVYVFFAVVSLTVFSVQAAGANAVPDFKEVSELIRANLPGVTESDLNHAALEGVLVGLHGKVALAGEANPGATNAPLVVKTMLLEGGVAYVGVARVASGLAKEIAGAVFQLGVSNKLKGGVLDLRYAAGEDYAVAAEVADLFVAKPRGLLDWGGGMVQSKLKKEAIVLPLAVLVNGETAGAAEALAGVLRETGAGLVLGSKTAGQAMSMREFALKNGQRLQIASAPVRLGDGSALTTEGIKPDIAVMVNADDERLYYADAFVNLAKTNVPAGAGLSSTNQLNGTNRPARKRMSEAELVRKHREGADEEDGMPLPQEVEPEKPGLRDPVLVRAVDLLKGLAFIRESRAR